jgi:hypothetical protein
MKMRPSRYNALRGVITPDALASLVPLLLILLLLAGTASALMRDSESAAHRQQVFNRVVSAADYTVKSGAAKHDGDVRYPNWLEPSALTPEYAESLGRRAGLSELYLGLKEPDGEYAACIYRFVVVGEEKAIMRLHACGR